MYVCVCGWMDGCIYIRIDRWIYIYIYGRIDAYIDERGINR